MKTTLARPGIDPSLVEQALNWRYATKVFDKEKVIPEETLSLLLESLRLSPSSIGLQPWKFILVKNKFTRKELFYVSLQQTQFVDASHLLVLCSLKNISHYYIDELVDLEKKENNGVSQLEPFKAYAKSFIASKSTEELAEWMAEQVYIALGFFLSTCSMLGIDACPMEAFDKNKVDEILKLDALGVESRVAVAIGYRSENDRYALHKKTRWPKEKVIMTI